MSNRRNRSLRNLLLVHEVAFLVLVAVTGILSGLTAYYWQRTSAEIVRINNLIYLTEQIRSELFRQIQEAIRARLLEDRKAMHTYSKYSRRIDEKFNKLRQHTATKQEDKAVQEMQEAYRAIQNDMNKVFGDPYSVDYVVRMRILDPRFADNMISRFEGSYNQMKAILAKRHEQIEKTSEYWTRFAPILIPAFILMAVILVLITARIVRREFVTPMATVKEGAAVISRGQLAHRIPEKGVTEVTEIAESINRMAHDLSESRVALVESERQAALGALVPVIAHNIRNPLASIRATAQVLDDCENAEELQEGREAIIESIDRLGRWVNALVSYLHPLQPSMRQVRASALLEGAFSVLKPKLEEKDVRLERRGWENDAVLIADPDLMEQALAGLLANAIDASPRGARVKVEFGGDARHFRIRLVDAGPGLPFEPRPGALEPGPSTKRFGTGLGIPVAFKICQSHGWDLKFNTMPGRGTEVVITAPVAEQETG